MLEGILVNSLFSNIDHIVKTFKMNAMHLSQSFNNFNGKTKLILLITVNTTIVFGRDLHIIDIFHRFS